MNISLIPKVQSPTSMEEFIPISCYNVIYKIISMVLKNIIKLVIPSIVVEVQNAFIPGRSIQENLLLEHVMVRGYNKRKGGAKYTLKIDIKRAYDSTN